MVLLKVFRPAGQGRDGCYFLNDQKVTKESLGAASGEHLACGGAHSHCPQTPITGVCPFGCFVIPGGLSFDRAALSSRPTGACCRQNLQVTASITHRLVHPFLFRAGVIVNSIGKPICT